MLKLEEVEDEVFLVDDKVDVDENKFDDREARDGLDGELMFALR